MLTILSRAVSVIAGALAIALAVPVALLLIEIAAALPRSRSAIPRRADRDEVRVAVIVPAHDESAGIRPTISGIAVQLLARDRLLVVADNCADDTASVAAAAGAEVIERRDAMRIGKGYALDYALRHLAADPPDIVIVIDADCSLGAAAITTLVAACRASGRPVQALDLMCSQELSPVDHRVAELAWRVKNWVRPLGLSRLGLPCQLMGTGMAFPWAVIRAANLATGHLVEDMRLGLELALAGYPPVFCPDAVVTSLFPVSAAGSATQRQRWEHGHIQTIRTLVPRFFLRAIRRRNLALAVLAADLAVPPLALLALTLCGSLILTGVAVLLDGWNWSTAIAAMDLAGFVTGVGLAWLRWGRDLLPPASFLAIGTYVFAKLTLYRDALTRGAIATWVRTARSK